MFFQSVFCIEHWIGIPIYGQLLLENNFKRTVNCPATRVNMNEPSTLRTALSLLCDERYATTNKFSWELVIHCYITKVTEQRLC